MLSVALVFLSAFVLFLRTLCPTITSGDSGELLLAGLHLDVTHPPGYPLLACLLRLAMLFPVGGLMFRAGLIPVLAGAGAVAGLFAAVRDLTGRRTAAAVAAALLGTSPYLWWQATLLEKYALQLCLAAWLLRAVARPSGAAHRPAALWAVAFTHHALALFLAPVVAALAWERLGRRALAPRFLALALALMAVPFSLRLLYPAIRGAALHREPAAVARAINWAEPYHVRAWWDYHRLAYYGQRLSGHGARLAHPDLRDQPGYYPAQLTWPGVLLGVAGLVWLIRRRPPVGLALTLGGAASVWFAIHNRLPPALGPSYHQLAFLLLALGAGIAAGAGLSRLRHPGPGRLIAVLVFAGLGTRAAARFAVLDGGHHLGVFDLNRAGLAVAPPGAVVMAMFDYDMFALRALQDSQGLRPDLVPLPLPQRIGPGQFAVRRHYRPWAAAALPGAVLNFSDDDSGFVILRRLVEDNRRRWCFAISALSAPAVPAELFRPRGALFLARDGRCPAAAAPQEALRAAHAASSRSWFAPGAALAVHRILAETQGEMFWRIAGDVQGPGAGDVRDRLLRERVRLTPDEPAAWMALGVRDADAGRLAQATAAFERAVSLNPAGPEQRLWLIDLARRTGAVAAAGAMLDRDLATPPFATAPSAEAVRRRAGAGDTAGALEASRRVYAEVALAQGRALPDNPEFEMRRVFLLRFAADVAPGWAEAQAECAGLLLNRSRTADAAPYLARLRRLERAAGAASSPR